MKWTNITSKDLKKGVVRKLSLSEAPTSKRRRSPHAKYYYKIDGKIVLRVTLPNIHGGSQSLSTGFLTQIRKSLKLSTRQFEDLVACPLQPEQFEKILQEKIKS